MILFDTYKHNEQEIADRVQQILSIKLNTDEERKAMSTILSCIDLTTLEGSDTSEKISTICKKARSIHEIADGLPDVAAVCFYPTFVMQAKKELEGSDVQVASVAGAFPAGQSPIEVKVQEVKFAVEEGADEIDMVISRGKMLEGDHQQVFDEIAAIKAACGKAHLKVILETGELQSLENIRKASELAINAGADFIKTSTGKIQPAATPEAFLVMADTVREYYDKTGKQIGLKPAGGVSTPEQALVYYRIVSKILGTHWLHKKLFRIGASRLTDKVIDVLK